MSNSDICQALYVVQLLASPRFLSYEYTASYDMASNGRQALPKGAFSHAASGPRRAGRRHQERCLRAGAYTRSLFSST